MHEGIKRKSEVRCAQVAPGASRGLPYLGLNVHPLLVIDPPADYQHVSVRQGGVRRVPPIVVHIGQPRPAICKGIVSVGIGYPHVVTCVSTGHEELSVG